MEARQAPAESFSSIGNGATERRGNGEIWFPPRCPVAPLLRCAPGRGSRLRKSRGQPVQQLRVRRLVPLEAEVVGGADDAAAEVVLPDAVDHHPGGEGVLG